MKWPVRALLRILAFCFLPACAGAHPLVQNGLWVVVEPERVHVAVDVTVRETRVAQGREKEKGHLDAELAVQEVRNHVDYVLSHLHLRNRGALLQGKLLGISPPTQFGDEESTRFQIELAYACANPGDLEFSHTILSEHPYSPGQPWEVTYVVQAKHFRFEGIQSGLLRPGGALKLTEAGFAGTAPVSAGPEFGMPALRQYLVDGFLHILGGYDHLLFVGALLLAAASLRELVKVIAAFTLAHTITLGLAALNVVRVPSGIVEPVIAASIVFVAVENVFWPGHTRSRLRLMVAFGFGLIHGLGFAGGLLEAMQGLPVPNMGWAIAAFSLGVELGHMAVVIPVFVLLHCGQRFGPVGFRPAVLRYGSIVITFLGVYYFWHAL